MFINDIFKKKQLDEGGPFSSTEPKKPRKGSVADLAAQKRREQEKSRQPVEPRDQRVGVARVVKDVAEGFLGDRTFNRVMPMVKRIAGEVSDYDRDEFGEELWSLLDQKYGPKFAQSVLQDELDFYWNEYTELTGQDLAEGSLNEFAPSGGGGGRWYSDDQLYEIIGEDWLEAFDVSGDQGNIDLRGERARLFLAQEAEAWLTDRGYRVNVLDVRDDGDELSWYIQGPLYRGLAEGTQVLKLNDYDQWSNKVDAQGAVKHVQKNRTFVVAQSWNGETIGEFDTRSNQGWVMSHSEQNLAEDAASKIVSKMIPGGASIFNAADAVRRFRSGDTVGAGIAAAGTIPITSIPAAAVDMARDKYYTGSFLPSDEQRDLANLKRQVADMEKKNWTKLPDGSERSPDGRTIRGTVAKLSDEPQSKPVPSSMKPDSSELPSKSYPDDAQSVKEQQTTNPVSRYDQFMREPSTSDKPGTKYYVGSTEVTGPEFDTIKQQHMANRSQAELDLDDFAQQARQRLKPKVRESSAQEKLYKRHQELRKKSGLPDPEYYQELKKTYDMPHEERVKQTAQLKKKYGVTNEDRERYIEELQRAGYEIVTEKRMTCPECGGAAYEDQMLAEKQDACYHKVKSRYKVWPSAYASGALVRCRKKGAKNWGNKSKK